MAETEQQPRAGADSLAPKNSPSPMGARAPGGVADSTARDAADGTRNPPANRGFQRTAEAPQSGVLLDWAGFTFFPAAAPLCLCSVRPLEVSREACGGWHGTGEEWQEQQAVEVAKWLGMDPETWDTQGGRYHYRKRITDGAGVDVNYDGQQPGMGMHVEVTGQGCRHLEESGRVTHWPAFLAEVRARGGRFTRLDGAMDDRAGVLDLRRMEREFNRGNVVTHYQLDLKYGRRRAGWALDAAAVKEAKRPLTLYFGKPHEGRSGIRIYDKRQERIDKGFEDPGTPWIRVELVAKGKQAEVLAGAVLAEPAEEWGRVVAGAIRAKLDFKRRPAGNDTNRRRWPTASWWAMFLDTTQEIRLSPKTAQATVAGRREWLEKQAAKSLAIVTRVQSDGPGDWAQDRAAYRVYQQLVTAGEARLTRRDWDLIAAYQRQGASG